jgi:hypothetical protein
MKLAGIKEQDIVQGNWHGSKYYARVKHRNAKDPGGRKGIVVEPLNGRPIPARFLTAHQVVEHYAKRAGK